jgi:predicted nucleotidyltransferase
MVQYDWASCPVAVRTQIETLCEQTRAILDDDLVGIYLHGSLTMGCFNPERSDIDLLVVTTRPMALDTKRRIMAMLLHISNNPRPVEIHFLVQSGIHPFQHPLPFDLHYSESWREQMREELANGMWQRWNDSKKRDPDLAAHLTIMHAHGIVLYGRSIADVLPVVPGEDYATSIIGDYVDVRETCKQKPMYFVLNACRVLAYLKDKKICSKDEGGVYGLATLPTQFHALLQQALEIYRGTQPMTPFDEDLLDRFVVWMDQHILDPKM